MDALPAEIRTRILLLLQEDHPPKVLYRTYAHLASVNRAWHSTVLPFLYQRFEESMMDQKHLDAIVKRETIHEMVETISVSLLDLCVHDDDDLAMFTESQHMEINTFDYEQETKAVDYDLALSKTVSCFTRARRLDLKTYMWDSTDYRRSKYTLHSLLSLCSSNNITCLVFGEVEHWEGMLLLAQFIRASVHLQELDVHVRSEGEYREAWQREDFMWTTREHFTCVQMCRALADASSLKRISLGDMCLAMTHPDHPSRNFNSRLQHLILGPQSSAGPIIYDVLYHSAQTIQTVKMDPDNLVQANYYGTIPFCPNLRTLHLDSLNPETDYPGTLHLFAGCPVRHLKLDGYVSLESVADWLRNGELPKLEVLEIELMDFCPEEIAATVQKLCLKHNVHFRLDSWPLDEDRMEGTLDDYLG